MTPFIADHDFTLYLGDVADVIRELPDASVDCVVTSPPYWALRDYGVAGQIGLEDSPFDYVARIVAVFREVRRVLAPHGTVWLNLGDTYSSKPRGSDAGWDKSTLTNPDSQREVQAASLRSNGERHRGQSSGLKEKELVGIPWRVALALQDDGWYLRSDVIWSKPNTMPESVTDRPTKSHEYVFMLSKSRRYFFDQEAVREPTLSLDPTHPSFRPNSARIAEDGRKEWSAKHEMSARAYSYAGRNVRSVWEITTQPYRGAHFAVMPPELVRRCLLAGCPAEVCRTCGKPRKRIVERGEPELQADTWSANGAARYDDDAGEYVDAGDASTLKHIVPTRTVGWTECECAYPGLRPGDLELIYTPTGEHVGADPSMEVGRAGLSRPRGDNEGVRPITRYEQRRYADQLRLSPYRPRMEADAGTSTFAHYLRTDRSGARPVPPELLERWLGERWLERVSLPDPEPGSYRSGVVFDPFMGAGTTALVARQLGRHAVGIELNETYARLTGERLQQLSLLT